MNPSGWIGVDLDGTLARYDHWRGEEHIGEPIAPMVLRVKRWLEEGREVRIYTARVSNDASGRIASLIQDYTEKHIGVRLTVTNQKDYQMIFCVDDRAKQVIPNTGIFLEDLVDTGA